MFHLKYITFGAVIVMVTALTGCGSDEDKIVDIHGKVTRDGQPVPNCTLHFVPDKGRPSWGASDENGEFKLSYDLQRDGAEVGTHKVYVEFRPKDPNEEHLRSIGRWKVPKDEKEIIRKYGNPQKPAIELTVTDDDDPIEIKLD